MTEPMNTYMDEDRIAQNLLTDGHRAMVGGMWDVIGPLQRDYLIARGMRRDEFVLDVGCGALRGGVPLATYLEPGHYYGIDISQKLLDVGYAAEIQGTELVDKMPPGNLFATDDFEVPFGVVFDRALAISLYTHLTLDVFSHSLRRLEGVMRTGAVFHASVFEGSGQITRPSGITTYEDRDPFHFTQDQLAEATPKSWDFRWIGQWGHPRGQLMIELTRC